MDNSQVRSNVHIPELEDPKNSRILNRKQIEKRLQNLRPGEYDRICSNLTAQNKRLKQEVKDLHSKVEEIMLAKKMADLNSPRNPLIEEEIKKMKKELNLKYESMNYLKEQLQTYQATQSSQEMKNEIRHNIDKANDIDRQIKKLAQDKEQLEISYNANMQSYEEYHPKKQENYEDRLAKIKDENKELRRKIISHSTADKQHEKNSQQVIDKLYNLKQEEQKYNKAILESKNSRKKITVGELKNIDISQVSSLQKEIQMLKMQKKDAEKELVNEKIIKEQKKAKLQKDVRELMDQHKESLRRRQKALNQLNLYEAKDKQQKQKIIQQEMKAQIENEDKACQTDKIVPKNFRKQWIGKSQGISFDDSLFLQYRSQLFIKGVTIYKNTQQICCIKCHYESANKKRFETKLPLDSTVLRKYQNKKYVGKSNAFLQSFNVSLTQDKITRIELLWSDGEKSVEGHDNEGSTLYSADISSNERPISIFGTISSHGKNNYALQSLGCEINSIEQE